MVSERLVYERATISALDALHRIVQNDHVRRYLMDGQLLPREWTEERLPAAQNRAWLGIDTPLLALDPFEASAPAKIRLAVHEASRGRLFAA